MRERHQRSRGKDSAFGYRRHRERRDCRQHRDSDLNLRAALIPGRAMQQTGVLVEGLAAMTAVIALRKSHVGRRRDGDARLCHANRLGKKHPGHEQAAECATNSGTAKDHGTLASKVESQPL